MQIAHPEDPANRCHRRRPGGPGSGRPSACPGPAGEALRGRACGRLESSRLGPCPSLHALALLRRHSSGGAAAASGLAITRGGDLPNGRRARLLIIWSPWPQTPELAAVIETGARVTAISRLGFDKVVSRGREKRPFVLAVAIAWRHPPRSGARRHRCIGHLDDAQSAWGQRSAGGGETPFRRIAYGTPTSSAAPGTSRPG